MNKMPIVNPCLTIINLNVKWLYSSIKRHGVTEWIIKQDPIYVAYRKLT